MSKYISACASLRPGHLGRLVEKIKDFNPQEEEKMKDDSTRITIRIKKDLLVEFKKIFPYRGEMTGFILRCMEGVCGRGDVDPGQIKKTIIGRR